MGRTSSRILFAVLVLINSAWIFYVYLSVTQVGTYTPAKLAGTLEGTAERPFIYRTLVPWLARVIAPAVPHSIAAQVTHLPDPIQKTFNALREGGYDRQAAIVLLLMFLSLVGFAYAQQNFLTALGMVSSQEHFALPLLAQIFILPFSIFFGYIYDLPQLFLVTLGLLFLLRGEWAMYLITLALACLNKETTVLLIAVFSLYYLRRLPLKTFITLLTVQLLIFSAIRILLMVLFRNNPGTPLLLTLMVHYEQYMEYPPAILINLAFFLPLVFLSLRGWERKHPFLRAGSVMFVALFLMYFIAGMPVEFRVFLDALPVVSTLIYPPPPANAPKL